MFCGWWHSHTCYCLWLTPIWQALNLVIVLTRVYRCWFCSLIHGGPELCSSTRTCSATKAITQTVKSNKMLLSVKTEKRFVLSLKNKKYLNFKSLCICFKRAFVSSYTLFSWKSTPTRSFYGEENKLLPVSFFPSHSLFSTLHRIFFKSST